MTEKGKMNQTILIVDDNLENVSLLEEILSAEYTIKTATSGSEALEITRARPPDLILLDIMMPEMDGYAVCTALKADIATRRIPVIFVTALLNSDDETHGFEVGGADYITKPVVGPVVLTRVKAQLALRESQDDLEQWNSNLKKRLFQNITTIRQKTKALMSAEERATDLHGYVQSVELLSGIFELMENRFGVSSRAVSELAGDAARKMNLSAKDVLKVRLAGLLHDVGMLGNRRGSLEKFEDEMTANELGEYYNHPVRGQELFASIADLQDVGKMIRSHHEAFDGSGFPDGVKGENIPLGARLIAIADIIEHAASSVSGAHVEYAIMRARLHAGSLLDPGLIAYFTTITRIMYFEGKIFDTIGQVEVPPNELISGMQLARDLFDETGVLLLQKGHKLDSACIALIRRRSQINWSPENEVWIYVNNAEQ